MGPGIIDYLGLWTWDDVTEEEVGVYQGLEILVCDTSVDTCDLYMIGVMPSVGGPCRITDNCMGRFYMNTCSIYRRDVRFFDCSGCRIPVVYTIENDYDGDVSIDAEAGELRIWPSKRFGTYEIYFDAVMPSYFAACHFTVSITGCCSGLTGNVNCDFDGLVDISDLFYLVAYLFGDQVLENFCIYEANINGDLDLIIDIADLTALVNYLFVTFEPPASCTPW